LRQFRGAKIVFATILAGLFAFSNPISTLASDTIPNLPASGETAFFRTTANLRLRSGPSLESHVIQLVPPGTPILVTSTRDGEWYSVNFNGTIGYMNSEFLIPMGPGPWYQAASVTVMDARTGNVLYETSQHTRRYPASVTKVMTALLVLEHVNDLSQEITFSSNAVALPWYASRMGGIRAGDTMTVYQALYGLMLPSGNEVARALAEHVSGNVGSFVALMNHRAVTLGANNTRFVNPCGLPGSGQHTTSYDMALIMRAAIHHPTFNRIIGTAWFDFYAPNGEVRSMRNTNRMIHSTNPEFNPWVVGGKTGSTNAARHTLVTYARRDGHSLIISVLFAPRGATFTDTAALMEHGFSLLASSS